MAFNSTKLSNTVSFLAMGRIVGPDGMAAAGITAPIFRRLMR
jgi:Na+-driven multidrug efflux pump